MVTIRGKRSPIQPKESSIFDIARGFHQVAEIERQLKTLEESYAQRLSDMADASEKDVAKLIRELRTQADTKIADALKGVTALHETQLARLMQYLQQQADRAVAAVEYARTIQKGEPGEAGKDGVTPMKGVDYFTLEEVNAFVQMVLNKIRQPEDGKDAVITDDMLMTAVQTYFKKHKITTANIADFERAISPIRHAATMRGGGDTVAAGSNVTITRANGVATISAQTGSGGTWSTPAESPNGSITQFTVTAQPTDVVADGTSFFDGAGYTYAAGKITFTNPPTEYVRYR